MSQIEFIQHVSKSGLFTSGELVAISEKYIGIDSPALKWNLPNRKPETIVRFSRFSRRQRNFGTRGYIVTHQIACVFL